MGLNTFYWVRGGGGGRRGLKNAKVWKAEGKVFVLKISLGKSKYPSFHNRTGIFVATYFASAYALAIYAAFSIWAILLVPRHGSYAPYIYYVA